VASGDENGEKEGEAATEAENATSGTRRECHDQVKRTTGGNGAENRL